ncbi:MAG: hypothetical protein ACI3Y5_04380 [Prevotella sp.]
MKSDRLFSRHIIALTVVVLTALQIVIIIVSWLVPAIYPYSDMRPLLSSEGIRFLVGRLLSEMSLPPLLWIILSAMSWGLLRGSGLLETVTSLVRSHSAPPFAIRLSLYAAAAVAVAAIIVVGLMTLAPGAILLSATGGIWASSFLYGLIPLIALTVAVAASAYGSFSARFSGVLSFLDAMTAGLRSASPLIVLYVFIMQFVMSLLYVFGITI